MARAAYIDINTAVISEVSAQANTLGGQISSVQAELRHLQDQLSQSLTTLEDYIHMCIEKAVPIKRLAPQEAMVGKVVTLLSRASELAEEASKGLVNESDALQLAVDTMTGVASRVSVLSVLASVLMGETECGDDWINVGGWKTRAYTNSSKNWSPVANEAANDYSDFDVVSGFKEEYILNQHDYYKGDIACTATADAIVGSIVSGTKLEPTEDLASKYWSGNLCRYPNTNPISGSQAWSVTTQCQTIYNYVQDGTPVILRVQGHSVVAVGIRQNVDFDSITPADILIVDPGDGKIKTADEVYSGYYTKTRKLSMSGPQSEGFRLRIPS